MNVYIEEKGFELYVLIRRKHITDTDTIVLTITTKASTYNDNK